jgi:hypothetical protein
METVMKKYTLDLTDYKVGEQDFPMSTELAGLLRLPGIYKDGIETCDGVMLARDILASDGSIEINEADLALVKRVMNTLIAREHKPLQGQLSLGGVRYEEMIIRVFTLDKE